MDKRASVSTTEQESHAGKPENHGGMPSPMERVRQRSVRLSSPGGALLLALLLPLSISACGEGSLSGGDGNPTGPGAGGADSADGGLLAGDPNTPGGDLGTPGTNGLDLWKQHCASCHGDFAPGSALSSGNANGDFRLDVAAAIERHGDRLEAYIDMAMPQAAPDLCTGTCAATLGAYLRSMQTPTTISCVGDGSPAVGAREVKLLSSREYQHALEDLLFVPTEFGSRVRNHDGKRGGFVDMAGQSISSTLLDTYMRNAETVAAWAVENGRPFACGSDDACATRFVDEFLFNAFRGPVSEAQKTAYRQLFATYPAQGMQLALQAALTSPNFLYRVEVGVDIAEAQSEGYYVPGAAPPVTAGGGNVSTGSQPVETRTAQEFAPDSQGRLEGNARVLTENGSIRVMLNQPLTDPAVVELLARGSNHDQIWPDATVRVNGSAMGTQSVSSASPLPYRFDVVGAAGAQAIEVVFDNDSGVEPYGPGQDANLYVEEVRVYAASTTPAPAPASAPMPGNALSLLDDAPTDALVLTPFEFASTLAFKLTGSTPDTVLLAAAQGGQLATREGVRAQVVRLLESPRGRERMGEFVIRWFRLDEMDQVNRPDVPELTDAVKAAMLEEVKTHFLHVFYDEAVPYADFFGSDYTFLNRTLAEFYGVPGNFDESFTQTPVEGRGGPLASGAFMTINAHAERTAPILRAVRARQTALCHYIDPPNSPIAGDNIDEQRAAAQERVTAEEDAVGALSSRDFYFYYTDGIDACAGCHEKIINPMFGLEDFDHVGRLRPRASDTSVLESIHGMDVEVSLEGTLYGVSSTSDPEMIEYAGAKDLSNQIADTEAVSQCLARKAFRFLTGQTYVDRDLDANHQESLSATQRTHYSCVAADMLQAYETAAQSPKAMFIELATDSLMLFRR